MIFASLHLYKSVFLPVSLLVCHNFEWKLTFVNKKLAEAKQRISWIMPSWQLTVDLIAWVFFCISVCSTIHSSVSPELGWVKQNKTNWMDAPINNKKKKSPPSSSMMIHLNYHCISIIIGDLRLFRHGESFLYWFGCPDARWNDCLKAWVNEILL